MAARTIRETERNNVTRISCQQCGKVVKKPIPLDAMRSLTVPKRYDSVEYWEKREPLYMCAECYNAKIEKLKKNKVRTTAIHA